jgi:LDH2 family malate/lactate/ureidoglycolate dehydrogenase
MSEPRYSAKELETFARALLERAGLNADKASVVAETLLEGDLLGHDTHGFQLLAPYVADLAAGNMRAQGEPMVIRDRPAAITWDGNRLPGPWLVRRAMDHAIPRAKELGTCCVTIRRSHHIACLAAYLKRATDAGLMMILSCSDPATTGVAPHGGCEGATTPNPIAAGWPTDGDPVLLDVSASVVTRGLAGRLHREGKKLAGNWLVDAKGNLTNDPAVIFNDPKGAILPLGGIEFGHKGYALGLLIETLTGGLAGHGRADHPEGWYATVYLQILDPDAFGGRDDFIRQTSWLAEACRAVTPRPGVDRVRLPGERGLKLRAEQLANGVMLHPAIMPALKSAAEKYGITLPTPINSAKKSD